MPQTYTYRLPWPPSVNCYIRRGNNRSYMTKRGKTFRAEVCAAINTVDWEAKQTFNCQTRLAINIELTLPDRRARDIDNHIKATLDALQHAGVYVDDEQVDELRVKRLHVEPPGACDVTITEIVAAYADE